MKAHLRLEVKLDEALLLVIVYYVSFISYDFKMLGGKYENCVFSVVPVIYMPYTPFFLNLPNPEPTVYCLTGRSGADHCKYSSNKSS